MRKFKHGTKRIVALTLVLIMILCVAPIHLSANEVAVEDSDIAIQTETHIGEQPNEESEVIVEEVQKETTKDEAAIEVVESETLKTLVAIEETLEDSSLIDANGVTGVTRFGYNLLSDPYFFTILGEGIGSRFPELLVDEEIVFCLNVGKHFPQDKEIMHQVDIDDVMSTAVQKQVAAVMDYWHTTKGSNIQPRRAVTQTVIWAIVNGYGDTPTNLDTFSLGAVNRIASETGWSGAMAYYEALKEIAFDYETVPSFHDQIIPLEWNPLTSQFEATITDTNHILSKFSTYEGSGITINKDGNTLTISTPKEILTPTQVNAQRIFKVSMLGWKHESGEYQNAMGLMVKPHHQVNSHFFLITGDLPTISTTATDAADGDKIVSVGEEITITDKVSYTNLQVGQSYTVKGVLMDRATNTVLLDMYGKEVHATTSFIAKEPSGTVTMAFTFTMSLSFNTEIVVFEKLYLGDGTIEVCAHEDIEDEGQTVVTVKSPTLSTTATDDETKDHISNPDNNVTIIDVVSYQDLEIGKVYVLKGVLMDKQTQAPFLVNDKQVTSEVTFIPDKPRGSVEMKFNFDGSSLEGRTLVVFEYLTKNGVEIGKHTDIEDEGQTINFAKVHTKAADKKDGDQTAIIGDVITLVDTVSYFNLIEGKEYTIKGILMDKKTNLPFLVDGKAVRAQRTFIATSKNGTITLEFTFNSKALGTTEVVVFETLYYDDIIIGTHADINDKDQTIKLEKPKTPPTTKTYPKAPRTWDGNMIVLFRTITILTLSIFTCTAYYWKKRIDTK